MKGGLLQLIFVLGSLVFLLGIWLVLRGRPETRTGPDPRANASPAQSRGAGDEPPGAGPKAPKRAA